MEKSIKIKVAELLARPVGESLEYELPQNFDFEYGNIKNIKPLKGKIKLTNLGRQILADFNIQGTLTLSCSRCLKSFDQKIDLNFHEEYWRPEAMKNHKLEQVEVEFLIKNYKIDVWPAIFNEIVLNLPLKPLCKKNCKGLCQNCGVDLNKKKCKCR